jgi:disulfide bond formation protein DsbB
LLQRWPWAAAILISLIAITVGSRSALPWVALLLAAGFVVGSAFAFYHVGVEKHWFAGPNACTGAATAADTVEALKARILGQMPVRCDEPAWSLWGISLAGWNLLASLVMGSSCFAVFWRRPRRRTGTRRGIA